MHNEEMQKSWLGAEHARTLAQQVTAQIEKIPLNNFLIGAVASVGTSLSLRLLGRHHDALFVGQWAPTLLLVGLYSKALTSVSTRQEPLVRSEESSQSPLH
jgi:hypothetical protein